MSFSGKTLTFRQYNTHEGMKWRIVDAIMATPIDITGATINVLVQSIDESTTIIRRTATIIDPLLGTCKLVPVSGEMDIPGQYKVQLEIIFADTTVGYLQNMYITIISIQI